MGVFIIIGSILLIAAVMVFLVMRKQQLRWAEQSQRAEEYHQRQTRAAWAKAMIVNSRGGILGETKARVDLSLEVTPEDGATYRALTVWLIDVIALSNFQPGQELQVKIDADDPSIIYPNSTSATYIGYC